jgi:hypothetical protein
MYRLQALQGAALQYSYYNPGTASAIKTHNVKMSRPVRAPAGI